MQLAPKLIDNGAIDFFKERYDMRVALSRDYEIDLKSRGRIIERLNDLERSGNERMRWTAEERDAIVQSREKIAKVSERCVR